MKAHVSRVNFKSSNRYGRQYELQTIERYTTGDESDLPPPTSPQILASPGVAISLEKFRDELDHNSPVEHAETASSSFENQIKQRLLSESINEALPSGSDRIRSIRLVTAAIAAQVVIAAGVASWLLSQETPNDTLRLAALTALVASTLAFSWFGGALRPVLVILCFSVFSTSLPMVLALANTFLDKEVLLPLMVQLGMAVLGLTFYAWTTDYEHWSRAAEITHILVPLVFSSLVLTLIVGFGPISTSVTGSATMLLSLVYADCLKDSIVPAVSVDQLMADTLAVHLGVVGRAAFILRLKASKLARKANWF